MPARCGALLLAACVGLPGPAFAQQALPDAAHLQADARRPLSWRSLSEDEQAVFDLGYRVFNTEWVPANSPAGRIDGLGPLFNAQRCDACHTSRHRGRGPAGDGELPADLVVQLGRMGADGTLVRGTYVYGYVLNTAAVHGYQPEGRATVLYTTQVRTLADGSKVELREPRYGVDDLSGAPLASSTVLMPRIPPGVQGVGLLELVATEELERIAAEERKSGAGVHGRIAWVGEEGQRVPGRFGWQATEPSVASQVSIAFAREMGLSNPLVAAADCGADRRCLEAPSGGSPEVEPALFKALVFFERLHAVPAERPVQDSDAGARLFAAAGCADCHRDTLHAHAPGRAALPIHPYTDLLVHEMGEGLADRDLSGKPAREAWRTAPLWGLNVAYASGQPVRLLHDGRARSVEEAILWHDAEARSSRERFSALDAAQRRALVAWIESL
ncbi:MAG: c-type cytochrome [Proteobacteria bacterium]|nr:c-type cytochrome [Pseudomonadota bacterium]